MTQTLIEQLEALQQYVVNNRDDDMGIGMWPVECKGGWIKLSDLRAIIEQHKHEVAEPIGCINYAAAAGLKGSPVVWFKSPNSFSLPDGTNIYAAPQPDTITELVKALEDDAYAGTFQSMAGYRTALISRLKGLDN